MYIISWYNLFLLSGRNIHCLLVQPFSTPWQKCTLFLGTAFSCSVFSGQPASLLRAPFFDLSIYMIYIYMFCKDEYIYVYEYVLVHVNLRVCYFYVLVCLFLFVVGCFFHRGRERSALPHASLCNETVDIDRVTHNKFPLFIDNTSCPPQNLWK